MCIVCMLCVLHLMLLLYKKIKYYIDLFSHGNMIYVVVGDKPVFQCELCPATCGRKTDLRIHVQKLHTSDKPLKCKRCGKTFPDRYVNNFFECNKGTL